MTDGPHHHAHSHDGSPADLVLDEAFWDARYSSSSALWSGNPNPQLVTEAADLAPAAALDVGCGEGADALWLAGRGWHVTGVDVSAVALGRAATHARDAGDEVAARIDWLHADLTAWVPEPATYDLVSVQFMQLPRAQREALFPRLAAAVRVGGSLLVVGHHPSDLDTTVRRPPVAELFFTAADVAASLDPDRWQTVVSEARARTAVDPEDRTVTVHDTVLRARRTG